MFFRIWAYLDSVFCVKQSHMNRFTQADYRELLMQVKGELLFWLPFSFT